MQQNTFIQWTSVRSGVRVKTELTNSSSLLNQLTDNKMKTKQVIVLVLALALLIIVAGGIGALQSATVTSENGTIAAISLEAWLEAFSSWLANKEAGETPGFGPPGKDPYYVETTDPTVKGRFNIAPEEARHDLPKGFSAWLNENQVQQLQDAGYTVTEVGFGTPEAKPFCGDGQCKGNENEQSCPADCGTTPPPEPPAERTCWPDNQYPTNITRVNGGSGGAGVSLAILDNGREPHYDLTFSVCRDATGGGKGKNAESVKDGCDNIDQTFNHGTHVAGIAGANGGDDTEGIYGVAPEADLWMYTVCTPTKIKGVSQIYCYWDDVSAALYDATDKGVNIASMSIGGESGSSVLQDGVEYATSKGVLLVAAAGNENVNGSPTINYPAAYPEVIAVGAVDANNQPMSYSSRGYNDGNYVIEEGEVEFAAPLADETTHRVDIGASNCYLNLNGTSAATPHIAGLAATLWQGNASSTRTYLQSIATDIYTPGDDPATGFGFIVAP